MESVVRASHFSLPWIPSHNEDRTDFNVNGCNGSTNKRHTRSIAGTCAYHLILRRLPLPQLPVLSLSNCLPYITHESPAPRRCKQHTWVHVNTRDYPPLGTEGTAGGCRQHYVSMSPIIPTILNQRLDQLIMIGVNAAALKLSRGLICFKVWFTDTFSTAVSNAMIAPPGGVFLCIQTAWWNPSF